MLVIGNNLTFNLQAGRLGTAISNALLFTVLQPSQGFFTYLEMSAFPVNGCKT
jgi:hypothetical protein